jgi:hypothetical protein
MFISARKRRFNRHKAEDRQITNWPIATKYLRLCKGADEQLLLRAERDERGGRYMLDNKVNTLEEASETTI